MLVCGVTLEGSFPVSGADPAAGSSRRPEPGSGRPSPGGWEVYPVVMAGSEEETAALPSVAATVSWPGWPACSMSRAQTAGDC
jgi:hypothetical protein